MQRISRAADSIWRLAAQNPSSEFDLTDPRYWEEVERIEREMNSETGGTRSFVPGHDYGTQMGDHSDSSYSVRENADAELQERLRRERNENIQRGRARGIEHLEAHPDWNRLPEPAAAPNTFARDDMFGGRHVTRPGTSDGAGVPGWDYSFHAGPGRSTENDGLYFFRDAEDAARYSNTLEHDDDIQEARRRGWTPISTSGTPTVHKMINGTTHFVFFPDAANGNYSYLRHPGVDGRGSGMSMHNTFGEAIHEG